MKAAAKRVPGLKKFVRMLRGKPLRTPREYLLARLPKRSVGAEIGVHEGRFSGEILRTVRPERLHLIDPWKHEEGNRYGQAWYGGLAQGGQDLMDRGSRGSAGGSRRGSAPAR